MRAAKQTVREPAASEPAVRGAMWAIRQPAIGSRAALQATHSRAARLADRRIAARDVQARPAQAREPGAHPLPQLGGCLAGEGEAQDPFRPDHAVGDQPDQPGGHRLALARARAGDDRERLQRRGDHLGLLRGGLGQPEQPGQMPGLVSDSAHGLPRGPSRQRRPEGSACQGRAGWRPGGRGGPVISWPPSRAIAPEAAGQQCVPEARKTTVRMVVPEARKIAPRAAWGSGGLPPGQHFGGSGGRPPGQHRSAPGFATRSVAAFGPAAAA